jgi:hypothetical protein
MAMRERQRLLVVNAGLPAVGPSPPNPCQGSPMDSGLYFHHPMALPVFSMPRILARQFSVPAYAICIATAQACNQYKSILVVPCGERWSADDSLRPSFEDYVAADGLVAMLNRTDVSPEARAASLVWQGLNSRYNSLMACGSAVELVDRGFAGDVELCLEEDVSRVVYHLHGDHFIGETWD